MENEKPYSGKDWLRRIAGGELVRASYESPCLYRVPIMLRSHDDYIDDAIKDARRLVDLYWEGSESYFDSREEFEQTELVHEAWRMRTPPPWCLNDVVGWIEIRLDVLEQHIGIYLILPEERMSKHSKKKTYYVVERAYIQLPESPTNDDVRRDLIDSLEQMAGHSKLNKRHVDLGSVLLQIRNTDLVEIIRMETQYVLSR